MANRISRSPEPGRGVAIVTGASGEIGGAICMALSGIVDSIAVHYRENRAGAERVRDAIETGTNCVAKIFQADLRRSGEADGLVSTVIGELGRIAVLVNNAGVATHALLVETSHHDMDAMIDTNVKAAIFMTKAVIPSMCACGEGAIINISSVAALRGIKGTSVYSASKCALEGFTRAMAAELGRKRIRVNAVAPGIVQTHMTHDLRSKAGDTLLRQIALNEFGAPGDIGAVVAFLTSPSARHITGQVLHVDGGVVQLSVA